MKVKQIIAMIVVVALLMTGSVLVTMAYLTDSANVTNVFTVGNIRMTLDETKVTPDGEPVIENGVVQREDRENKYHLVPGGKYVKDPTATIVKNSDECYVRMMVTVNNYSQLKAVFPDFYKEFVMENGTTVKFFHLEGLVEGWNGATWACVNVVPNADNTATYEFRYVGNTENGTVAHNSESDTKLPALFEKVIIGEDVTKEQLEQLQGLKIDVVAHAMQADGFESAEDAWDAFDKKNVPAPSEPVTPSESVALPDGP